MRRREFDEAVAAGWPTCSGFYISCPGKAFTPGTSLSAQAMFAQCDWLVVSEVDQLPMGNCVTAESDGPEGWTSSWQSSTDGDSTVSWSSRTSPEKECFNGDRERLSAPRGYLWCVGKRPAIALQGGNRQVVAFVVLLVACLTVVPPSLCAGCGIQEGEEVSKTWQTRVGRDQENKFETNIANMVLNGSCSHCTNNPGA